MKSDRRISEYFADLLSYPHAGIAERAGQAFELLEGDHPESAAALRPFCDFSRANDLSALEETYTATFDLRPSCCPYLGYQLCGEGYQRSRFLVGLQEQYRRYGFVPDGAEMADHFAEVLRFLSVLDDPTARAELVEDGLVPAVRKGLDGIEDEDRPYGAVLRALLAWLPQEGAARFDHGRVDREERVS